MNGEAEGTPIVQGAHPLFGRGTNGKFMADLEMNVMGTILDYIMH